MGKLAASVSDLKVNTTIWAFRNDLVISYYDVAKRAHVTIATWKYEADKDKGLLKILCDNEPALTYEIGISSTGTYALLIRTKKEANSASNKD